MLVAQSYPTLRCHGLQPTRLFCPGDFPGKDTGVGCHFLPQGIFPTQGWNLGLLHCRQILHWLGYKESPYTWIYSFSDSFPLWFITKYWIWFPVLFSRSLLPVLYIVMCIYVNPKLRIYPSPTLSPLVTINLFSVSVSLFLFGKFICIIFFNSSYKCYQVISMEGAFS